jgi:NADH-quinone oxidoreductase subunit J
MSITFFWIFSVIAVISALSVILTRNPIYSVLSLIVCFFCIAGHYLLMGAPFLSAVHIIVYAGAIMVLFLFVIMLMNLKDIPEFVSQWWHYILAGVAVSALVFGISCQLFQSYGPRVIGDMSLKAISHALFTTYAVPFELSAILFLSAVIGVVFLGKSE